MSVTPPKDDTEQELAHESGDADPTGEATDGDMLSGGPQDSSMYETEVKEQDRWLPIANVARIMKAALPENAKIAKEAKECMQECVSEFISFVTSEAAEKCQHEKRKTVNGEDILYAMDSLGFENYGQAMKIYLSRYRESTVSRNEQQAAHRQNNAAPTASGSTSTHPKGKAANPSMPDQSSGADGDPEVAADGANVFSGDMAAASADFGGDAATAVEVGQAGAGMGIQSDEGTGPGTLYATAPGLGGVLTGHEAEANTYEAYSVSGPQY